MTMAVDEEGKEDLRGIYQKVMRGEIKAFAIICVNEEKDFRTSWNGFSSFLEGLGAVEALKAEYGAQIFRQIEDI
jgi:hypothetical protein